MTLADTERNSLLRTPPIDTGAGPDASGEANNPEFLSTLIALLQVLRKRLWPILFVVILLIGFTMGFSLMQVPKYEASSKILVGPDPNQESATPDNDLQHLSSIGQGLQLLTKTMAEGVNSRPIAETVIQQLGLQTSVEDFQKNLTAEQVRDTQYIQVTYRDTSPQRAQQIANSVGDVYSKQISQSSPEGISSPSPNAVTATLWEQARIPDEPVSPNLGLTMLVALATGVMLGVALAFLLEYRRDGWGSLKEVEQISGVPTFGVIPGYRRTQREAKTYNEPIKGLEGLVAVREPSSAAAEAYRTLRTNLLHRVVAGAAQSVLLTSPGSGEGKSTTCANLGVFLAQARKNVLAIDCDLRKPALHEYFGLRNVSGLADVLERSRSMRDVWEEPLDGLKVVSAGSVSRNPSELLETKRLSELLVNIRHEFDYVLLDASPVEMFSDAAILATQVDAVLLVLDEQNSRRGSVRQSVRSLEALGANVLGTVVNNVKTGKNDYYPDTHTTALPEA